MKRITLALLLIIFLAGQNLYADQLGPIVTEAEGLACMGRDKSIEQTENLAMTHAKRKAAEYASTYIKSETNIIDYVAEKDVIDAYTRAMIRIIQEVEKSWVKDQALGQCYKIRIKVEVVPDDKAMKKASNKDISEDPNAPLSVRIWTDKTSYRTGEKIKIFLKGNRPFFASIVYKNAEGQHLQLLPNPYRQQNYFQGGAIYEIPSGDDKYELEVTEPFGQETITVYASTSQVGELNLKAVGSVYEVKTKPKDIPIGTRGIKFVSEGGGGKPKPAAQFVETSVSVETSR